MERSDIRGKAGRARSRISLPLNPGYVLPLNPGYVLNPSYVLPLDPG